MLYGITAYNSLCMHTLTYIADTFSGIDREASESDRLIQPEPGKS